MNTMFNNAQRTVVIVVIKDEPDQPDNDVSRICLELSTELNASLKVIEAPRSGYHVRLRNAIVKNVADYLKFKRGQVAIFYNAHNENIIAGAAVMFSKNHPRVPVYYCGKNDDADIRHLKSLPKNFKRFYNEGVEKMIDQLTK